MPTPYKADGGKADGGVVGVIVGQWQGGSAPRAIGVIGAKRLSSMRSKALQHGHWNVLEEPAIVPPSVICGDGCGMATEIID